MLGGLSDQAALLLEVNVFLKLAELADEDLATARRAKTWRQWASALQPGDIILTRPSNTSHEIQARNDPFLMMLAPLVKAVDGGRWVHAALYAGNGKVIHAKRGLEGEDPSAQVREQPLEAFRDAMSDLMVVRPKVSLKARKAAVKRARSTIGTPYNVWDVVRAGLAPQHVSGAEEWPDRAICTAVPGYAYPQIPWRPGVSIRHIRPNDYIRPPYADRIIAYTPDKTDLDKVAKLLIERARDGRTARSQETQRSSR